MVHRRYCAIPPLNGQNAPSPARNAFPRVTPCAVAPLRQPSTPAGRRPSSRPNRPPGPALSSSPSPVPCGCTFERSERPIARAKRLPARHAGRRRAFAAAEIAGRPLAHTPTSAALPAGRLSPSTSTGRPRPAAGVCDAHIPWDRARWAPVDARAHRATLSSPPL